MNKPHKHAEVIKAAADGKDIEVRKNNSEEWMLVDANFALSCLNWQEHHEYRIKQDPVYPVTRMEDHELAHAFINDSTPSQLKVIRDGVNIAIRRAIQDGDVVLPGEKK
jgi:hypothetical protein